VGVSIASLQLILLQPSLSRRLLGFVLQNSPIASNDTWSLSRRALVLSACGQTRRSQDNRAAVISGLELD
jgi:hypothetical protein